MSVNDFQLTETPLLSRSSVGRAEELRSDAAALTTGWADALLLRVNSRGQVKVSPEGQLVFAEATELGPEPVRGAVFLGIRENRHVWAVRVSLLAGTLSELRMLGGTLDDADAGLLTGAVAILNWHDSAGFSAIDGAPSEPTMSGWSRISTSTGHEEFPRTDPAVICLVHDGGDRVLLARQRPGRSAVSRFSRDSSRPGSRSKRVLSARSRKKSVSTCTAFDTSGASPGRSLAR